MATNGSFGQQEQYKGALEAYPAAPASINTASQADSDSGKLTNDQVGWYFVEQYYTTLSKAPEKLHVSAAHWCAQEICSHDIALLRQAVAVRLRPRG